MVDLWIDLKSKRVFNRVKEKTLAGYANGKLSRE